MIVVFERRQFFVATGTSTVTLLTGCVDGWSASWRLTATQTDPSTDTTTETGDTELNDTEATEVVANNVGVTAREFTGNSRVAGDGENPTITLEPGTRYIVKRGWSAHSFTFLDDDSASLLTQAGGSTFADDSGMN